MCMLMSQLRDIWLRFLRYQTRIEAEKNESILLKSAARKHEVQRVVQRSTPMWSVYCAVSHVNEVSSIGLIRM